MVRTKDATKILDTLVGDDAGMRRLIAEEEVHAHVAAQIVRARKAAGLSQRELAERVGTSQPAIARVENANYRGHSLRLLRRIAEVLDLRVEIRLVPRLRRRRTVRMRKTQGV